MATFKKRFKYQEIITSLKSSFVQLWHCPSASFINILNVSDKQSKNTSFTRIYFKFYNEGSNVMEI